MIKLNLLEDRGRPVNSVRRDGASLLPDVGKHTNFAWIPRKQDSEKASDAELGPAIGQATERAPGAGMGWTATTR